MFIDYLIESLRKIVCSFYFACFVILCSCFTYLSIEQETVIQYEARYEPETSYTYMLHGHQVDTGYLQHVRDVLDRIGYTRVTNTTDFDLLWSHVYPFGENPPFQGHALRKLKPFQKVNHFPGSGYVTNKAELASTRLKYIPRAFLLPTHQTELIAYSQQNPDKLFVQKNTGHRGVRLVTIDNVDFNNSDTFVQEFVDKPLLVDGHKFDIGVYTILTSIDPLRVYIYNGDFLLRFCPKQYEPFNPDDIDQYVVGDDYIPTWEMPSLRRLYKDLKFGMKDSLAGYLKSRGLQPKKIWNQIEDSIRTVFLNKEHRIIKSTNVYNNRNNFFEMVRFDFVVDSDLNVYLMEANMSPNLSSEHFPPNKLLYENVLFNLFSLVGNARRVTKTSLTDGDTERMQVTSKNLMVFPNECLKEKCNSCTSPLCLLCKHCLTDSSEAILKNAYLEHVNRLDCKRVFPPAMDSKTKMEDLKIDEYSPDNRMMMLWFLGKCLMDSSWC